MAEGPHIPVLLRPLLAERIRINTEAFTRTGDFVGIVEPSSGY